MSFDLYRVTPRVAREYIVDCIQAGLVPFVQSDPGMGKSSIMRSVADQFMLKMIDHRLSTSAPEDLSGLPEFYTNEHGNRRAHFAPFDKLFPLEDTPLPTGYDGWMVFLDEMNSGREEVQAASYKLVLDKMTGQEKLHERVVLTAAGNLNTSGAIVNDLATAMQSRVVHIELTLNFQEFLEDVLLPQKWDPRIVAFLMHDESQLMVFDANHDEKTFRCPRTWEFMNKLLLNKEFALTHEIVNGTKVERYEMDRKTALYAGTIGAMGAASFVNFTKVFAHVPKYEDVMRNPTGVTVPSEHSLLWATVSSFMQKTSEDNFDKLATYFNRFDLSFRILFFRNVMINHAATLRHHPAFTNALIELDQYLNG